ncbi:MULTISPECIES: histidine phosphatase family protein [Streptomyces]|uniref:Histidine phosphatase family protein n=1 Tax=Streptomyces chilikensis TaxID=1194079 RepID=A0ABV3EMM0_9ACTN|nr:MULTISPECIES: histidine phosphatase family protein [Streptomyces]MDH6223733.1 broad specificity phosphatase PhoE [Streptomyces sp. MJP52]
MRLLLIRHGQIPPNARDVLDTRVPGPPLTELGERQAQALPDALHGEDITALFASTLVRTQLTARPLARKLGLEIRVRDGIREITAGEFEGESGHSGRGLRYMEIAFSWAAGQVTRRMPGGEDGVEMLGRYDAVVEEASALGADVVAFLSHGAAIRTWTAARADNVDVEFAASHPLENTGVVVLEGSPQDGWKALSWAGAVVSATGPDAGSGPTGRPVE